MSEIVRTVMEDNNVSQRMSEIVTRTIMEDNNVSGQISNDTLRFLKNLQNPRRNDRQWYILSFLSHFFSFSLFSSGSNSMVDFSTCPPLTLTLTPPPEPVYRTAEKEWITFIESLTDLLIQVDPQIPPLPPKDLIHRIYRDVNSFLSSSLSSASHLSL